mmetsp:Transcript_7757/g.20045  ORF Transcript_7757/g.20045 Transcript_7757/m.20045 type:complete len:317 (+) Transcript_7757:199-1149(+)
MDDHTTLLKSRKCAVRVDDTLRAEKLVLRHRVVLDTMRERDGIVRALRSAQHARVPRLQQEVVDFRRLRARDRLAELGGKLPRTGTTFRANGMPRRQLNIRLEGNDFHLVVGALARGDAMHRAATFRRLHDVALSQSVHAPLRPIRHRDDRLRRQAPARLVVEGVAERRAANHHRNSHGGPRRSRRLPLHDGWRGRRQEVESGVEASDRLLVRRRRVRRDAGILEVVDALVEVRSDEAWQVVQAPSLERLSRSNRLAHLAVQVGGERRRRWIIADEVGHHLVAQHLPGVVEVDARKRVRLVDARDERAARHLVLEL